MCTVVLADIAHGPQSRPVCGQVEVLGRGVVMRAFVAACLLGGVVGQRAGAEDRAAAKSERLHAMAERRRLQDGGSWGGYQVGWDPAYHAEPVPAVMGQPMEDDLNVNPYPFYSFEATFAGQEFHIGVNDITVGDTGLYVYDTDRTTLLADIDNDNCGLDMTGSACSESVDCPPNSPLCAGYAEETVFVAPAAGTYYAMGHYLWIQGDFSSPGFAGNDYNTGELSLTVRDSWPGGPPPPPQGPSEGDILAMCPGPASRCMSHAGCLQEFGAAVQDTCSLHGNQLACSSDAAGRCEWDEWDMNCYTSGPPARGSELFNALVDCVMLNIDPQNSKARAMQRGEPVPKTFKGAVEIFPAGGPGATICRKQPAGSGQRYKCAFEAEVRGLF